MQGPAALADHLHDRASDVIERWREEIDRAGGVSTAGRPLPAEFPGDVADLIDRLADRLRGGQSDVEASARSLGKLRRRQGYDLAEVVAEIGHLRTAMRRSYFEAAKVQGFGLDELMAALDTVQSLLDGVIAEAVREHQRESRARTVAAMAEADRDRAAVVAILDLLPTCVWVLDEQGRIAAMNAEAIAAQGVDAGLTLGVDLSRDPGPHLRSSRPDGTPLPADERPSARVMRGEVIRQQHVIWNTPRGPRDFLVDARPLPPVEGRPSGAVIVAQDVTDLADLRRSLTADRERLRRIAEVFPGLMYEADLAADRVERSEGLASLVGYKPGEDDPSVRWWRSRVHPDDLPRVLAAFAEAAARLEPRVEAEYRARHRDGRWVWIRDRCRVVYDPEGRPSRLVGISLDVTDAKRAEAEARAVESRFRSTFEDAAIGIGHVGLDGRWLRANPALCALLGYDLEELCSLTFADITDEADRRASEAKFARLLEPGSGPITLEKRYRRKDGAAVDVRVTGSLVRDGDGRPDFVVNFVEDVTERRRAEEAQARYSTLLEQSSDPILFVNPVDGRIVDANRAAEVAYGYGREALLGLSVADLRASETLADVPGQLAAAASRGVLFETVHRRRDGTTFPVEINSRGVDVGGSRVVVSTIRDLTARRRSERAIREGEERLRMAVEATGLGTWDCDLATGDLEWSERSREIYGVSDGEPASVALFLDRVHPEDRPRVERSVADALDPSIRRPQDIDFRICLPDGTLRWVGSRGRATFDGDGPDARAVRFVGTVLDITTRKRLEAELAEQRARAEEASLHKSRMLQALSHDARTPLNAVVLSTELLGLLTDGGPEPDPEVAGCLRTIRHSVQNVLDLLNDLLDLTRLDAGALPPEIARFELLPAVEECAASVEAQARRKGLDFRVETAGLAGLLVDTDRAKFKQILGNFLSNALRYTDTGQIRVGGSLGDGRLRVEVEDSGVGIAPADLARIFDEFATLESGRRSAQCEGTGLGLAICRRLAGLLRGEIRVESEPGRGSTFALELPGEVVATLDSGQSDRSRAAGPVASCGPPVAGVERGVILLADDHADSRRVMARVLGRLGYRSLEAENGREAVELARGHRPSAALFDVVMPIMDGIEAARELRDDPELADLPIFALTGDLAPETRRALEAVGFRGVLPKPVTSEAIRRLLAEIVDPA